MENLDEDEYGYTTGVTIHNKLKNDLCLEDTFMDALASLQKRKPQSYDQQVFLLSSRYGYGFDQLKRYYS